MITEVATTPPQVLTANPGAKADATVIVMFARSMKQGDAMGVTLTRSEAGLLAMQLCEYLEESEPPELDTTEWVAPNHDHVPQAPTDEQATSWGKEEPK